MIKFKTPCQELFSEKDDFFILNRIGFEETHCFIGEYTYRLNEEFRGALDTP